MIYRSMRSASHLCSSGAVDLSWQPGWEPTGFLVVQVSWCTLFLLYLMVYLFGKFLLGIFLLSVISDSKYRNFSYFCVWFVLLMEFWILKQLFQMSNFRNFEISNARGGLIIFDIILKFLTMNGLNLKFRIWFLLEMTMDQVKWLSIWNLFPWSELV